MPYGALAQLVVRYIRIVEARGSTPLCSTREKGRPLWTAFFSCGITALLFPPLFRKSFDKRYDSLRSFIRRLVFGVDEQLILPSVPVDPLIIFDMGPNRFVCREAPLFGPGSEALINDLILCP